MDQIVGPDRDAPPGLPAALLAASSDEGVLPDLSRPALRRRAAIGLFRAVDPSFAELGPDGIATRVIAA